MRDKISKITDEVGKLLDLQTQLLKKRTFLDLAPRGKWMTTTHGETVSANFAPN